MIPAAIRRAPLFPRNLFIFLSSWSTSFSPSSLSACPILYFSQFSTYSRRHDDESRNVPVSVWWDFENCNVPAGVNVFKVSQTITEALRANGIKGRIQITAFGDVLQLSRAKQEALSATGINLTHIPNGGKNSADRSLLVDLMYWVSQNPPPAHLFLISGDRDFSGILHRLRMNNYNILLASSEGATDVLCSAATIMWQWNSLLNGENLSGKHFNHPPDGPFGSWYGHFKVPLEDPFSAGEQCTSSQSEKISEPIPDSKSRAVIPKAIGRQIQNILNLHPKGLSITDLRAELVKSDLRLDKYLYGYKRFSHLLLSVPHIRMLPDKDGQFLVRLVRRKSLKPSESSVVPVTSSNNEDCNNTATLELNYEAKYMAKDADGTPSMASSHEVGEENILKQLQHSPSFGESVDDKSSFPPSVEIHGSQPPNEMQHSPQGGEKAVDLPIAQVIENPLPPKENETPKAEVVSLKKTYRKLSDNRILISKGVSHRLPEKYKTPENHSADTSYKMMENNGLKIDRSEKSKVGDKDEKLTRQEADAQWPIPYSSSVDESVTDKRTTGSTETYSENSSKSLAFFSWIRNWWPFWRSGRNSDDKTTHQQEIIAPSEAPMLSEPNHMVGHSGKPELFSTSSFWSSMESFVFTPRGSVLISQSRNREDMVHNLQKDGPLILRSLSESDLLQLVELLISEKKWLEESPSQTLPFRLTRPVGQSSSTGQSHGTNGLRSLFESKTTSQSNLQNLSENDVEKQYRGIPHTGVSPTAIKRKHTEKSRSDILTDCQKLVNEIVREHPEGYNLGSFRKLFLERYGYHLDLQKLGYQKLASLLQILPGVKIESTYIIPSDYANRASDRETSVLNNLGTNNPVMSNSDSELSDSAPKDDCNDSPWEELGPVAFNNAKQSDVELRLSGKAIELERSKRPDYEPVISDDDSSESEEESPCLTQSVGQGNPKCNEESSSLLQILESYYSSKERDDSVKKPDNLNATSNGVTDGLSPYSQCTPGTLSKISTENCREKQRLKKSYLFVADPVSREDKPIDGILDSLKKADELKVQR